MATICNDDGVVVAALGGVEIISYGTLYYCVAVVASEVARDLAVTEEWIFSCFSFSLLASALTSLSAGHLMDRYGAGRMMKFATVAGAISLGIAAVSWNAVAFAIALFGMQIASAFLFYEAAFVFLVQRNAADAKRQITLLTLIVGFSSTLFWPLTSLLLTVLSWREVFGIYAGCNIFVALPLIVWALRRRSVGTGDQDDTRQLHVHSRLSPKVIDLALITVGFSLTTFVFSAFLSQMIPILLSNGLDQKGALVSGLFGPSQVLIRLFAVSLTRRIAVLELTIISSVLLSAAVAIVALGSHSVVAAASFVVLFGFSSGLNSICRAVLPLAMFGQDGYGRRLGLINIFRLSTASFAPAFLSVLKDQYSIAVALASLIGCGLASVLAFVLVDLRLRKSLAERDNA